jgi:hypothetical protein
METRLHLSRICYLPFHSRRTEITGGCQGLISEHPCSDIRPARIISDTRLSTAASDLHHLHYITFYPYLLHIISCPAS